MAIWDLSIFFGAILKLCFPFLKGFWSPNEHKGKPDKANIGPNPLNNAFKNGLVSLKQGPEQKE